MTVISHLGRPDGSPNPKYSLEPVARRLGELLEREVAFEATPPASAIPGEAGVTVLENLRFDPRETSKDAGERQSYADELARFGEVFVSTSLEVAESRDVKGLYARARAGEITGMTGVDDPYEQPATAELTLDTAAVPLDEAVEQAYRLLTELRRTAGDAA